MVYKLLKSTVVVIRTAATLKLRSTRAVFYVCGKPSFPYCQPGVGRNFEFRFRFSNFDRFLISISKFRFFEIDPFRIEIGVGILAF